MKRSYKVLPEKVGISSGLINMACVFGTTFGVTVLVAFQHFSSAEKLLYEPLPLIEAGVSDLHYIMSR
jgi:hypothetical protein